MQVVKKLNNNIIIVKNDIYNFFFIYVGHDTVLRGTHNEKLNGSLIFNPVLKEDDGSYECVVENGIGQSISKAVQLVVHGKIMGNWY